MRAMQLAAPAPAAEAPLRLVELPLPQPGAGQVLLRVLACGVCRTDLHILEGELPPHRSPVIPGHQIVGEVVALGVGAERISPGGEAGSAPLRLGDRVGVPWLHQTDETCRFCRRGQENLCEHATFTGWDVDGGFAEYTVAPAGFVYRLPAGMEDLAAAPLLWVLPLSLYLLTWVLVFQSRPLLPHKWMLLLQPLAITGVIVLLAVTIWLVR